MNDQKRVYKRKQERIGVTLQLIKGRDNDLIEAVENMPEGDRQQWLKNVIRNGLSLPIPAPAAPPEIEALHAKIDTLRNEVSAADQSETIAALLATIDTLTHERDNLKNEFVALWDEVESVKRNRQAIEPPAALLEDVYTELDALRAEIKSAAVGADSGGTDTSAVLRLQEYTAGQFSDIARHINAIYQQLEGISVHGVERMDSPAVQDAPQLSPDEAKQLSGKLKQSKW